MDYIIVPAISDISRKDLTINSLSKYYMPLAEIKDFNALIDNKLFFDQPAIKKHMKNLLKCPETVATQQESSYILCTIKFIINSLHRFIRTSKYDYS